MKCAACGVVVPDAKVTYMGEPICVKCMLKGFGIKQSPINGKQKSSNEVEQ